MYCYIRILCCGARLFAVSLLGRCWVAVGWGIRCQFSGSLVASETSSTSMTSSVDFLLNDGCWVRFVVHGGFCFGECFIGCRCSGWRPMAASGDSPTPLNTYSSLTVSLVVYILLEAADGQAMAWYSGHGPCAAWYSGHGPYAGCMGAAAALVIDQKAV